MNKRYKELAREAGYTTDMFGIGHWDMPEFQKFAELIVKECVDKMQNDYYGDSLDDICKQIKEHFGVEE